MNSALGKSVSMGTEGLTCDCFMGVCVCVEGPAGDVVRATGRNGNQMDLSSMDLSVAISHGNGEEPSHSEAVCL